MKLQQREKVLLVILLIVAITLLPWFFVIQPLMTENSIKKVELDALDMQYADLEQSSLTAAIYQETLQELRDEYGQGNVDIPPKAKTYDLHYMVEDACNTANVTLEGLQIEEYAPLEADDLFFTTDGEEAPAAILQKATVNASLTGGFNQIMQVIDSLSANLHIVPVELNIDNSAEGQPAKGTMKLDIYAIVQPGDPEFEVLMPNAATAEDDGLNADGE